MKVQKRRKTPKKDVYTTNLRLPHEVAELVKKAADVNNRSLNGEIVNTLEEKYA